MPAGKIFQHLYEGSVECLADIRHLVGQAVKELGADEKDIFACQLAADEAASNVFEHAYAKQGGRLEVKVWREGDDGVISVHDWGAPFDPTKVPEPDLNISIEQRPAGGLGLFLIHQFMDQVSFEFDATEGNMITMRRRLGRKDRPKGAA